MELKNSAQQKKSQQNQKANNKWEKVFANNSSSKGLISKKIYKEIMQLNIKQITQLKYGQKTWTDTSLRKTYKANRYMKRSSVLLAIKGMQIKTKMRYNFTPVRMGIINKKNSNLC